MPGPPEPGLTGQPAYPAAGHGYPQAVQPPFPPQYDPPNATSEYPRLETSRPDLAWPDGPAARPHTGQQRNSRQRGSRHRSLRREIAVVVVLAIVISWILKTFFIQSFTIPSQSMENTLQVGDRIIVNRMVGADEVQRGDVIVFVDPGNWYTSGTSKGGVVGVFRKGLEFIGLAPVDKGHLVKRVIGLPGDRVQCCDAQKRLLINGKPLTEPYLYPGNDPSDVAFDITVPAGRLWVMGDHRAVSGDSRVHLTPDDIPQLNTLPDRNRLSAVPKAKERDVIAATVPFDNVVGRVSFILWPRHRLGGFDSGTG